MTEEELQVIKERVAVYDDERARGIVHDHGYVVKMEQYRLSL